MAGALLGLLGSVAGASAGPLSEGMSGIAQYQASKHERNIAWKRQQQWELIAPSLRVAGLRAAGLNPVLAATQGMSGGGSHVATASPGGKPHFDKGVVGAAVSSAKQMQAMDAQVHILKQQALQENEKTRQAVIGTNVQEKFSEASAKAELSVIQEQFLNLVAQRGLSGARTLESEQARLRIGVDRMLMEMGVPSARAMEELYTKYPWLRQVQGALGGGIGGLTSGAVGGAAGFLMGRDRKKSESPTGFGELTPGSKRRRK